MTTAIMELDKWDRSQPNTPSNVLNRFKQWRITWGATHIYKYEGRIYATGDITHCPHTIDKNIRAMVKMLLSENLTCIMKAYDSDLFKSKKAISKDDWEALRHDCWLYIVPIK